MTHSQLSDLYKTELARVAAMYPIGNIPMVVNYRIKSTLGLACYENLHIELSSHFFLETKRHNELARNVILHELAHIISYTIYGSRGHGATWRAVAIKIGCSGDRCEKVSRNDAIEVACENGHTVYLTPVRYRRAVTGHTSYVCRTCNGKISPIKKKVVNLFQKGI